MAGSNEEGNAVGGEVVIKAWFRVSFRITEYRQAVFVSVVTVLRWFMVR